MLHLVTESVLNNNLLMEAHNMLEAFRDQKKQVEEGPDNH